MTPNIADQAITTPKIAPGAVSVHQIAVTAPFTIPHGTSGGTTAVCPSGFVVTGDGYGVPAGDKTVVTLSGEAGPTGWVVEAFNGDTIGPICAAIQP